MFYSSHLKSQFDGVHWIHNLANANTCRLMPRVTVSPSFSYCCCVCACVSNSPRVLPCLTAFYCRQSSIPQML